MCMYVSVCLSVCMYVCVCVKKKLTTLKPELRVGRVGGAECGGKLKDTLMDDPKARPLPRPSAHTPEGGAEGVKGEGDGRGRGTECSYAVYT